MKISFKNAFLKEHCTEKIFIVIFHKRDCDIFFLTPYICFVRKYIKFSYETDKLVMMKQCGILYICIFL